MYVVIFIRLFDQNHLALDSLTIKLVSNISTLLFPDKTKSSFANFLPEQMNLERQFELQISEISYSSIYQNFIEEKLMFFKKTFSKSSKFHYLAPGLYPSFTDIVEIMNTLIQERQNHRESFIIVRVS